MRQSRRSFIQGSALGLAALRPASAQPALLDQASIIIGFGLSRMMLGPMRAIRQTALRIDPGLAAPVHQGQRVGSFTVSAPDFPTLSVPVYAAQPVARIGLFGGLWRGIFNRK